MSDSVLLTQTCQQFLSEPLQLEPARKNVLQELGTYLSQRAQAGKKIQLTVICTHNSRRSHIGQLWLQTAAQWFKIPDFSTFSGGTEATAFHPNAIAALERAGFVFEEIETGRNPVYQTNLTLNQPIELTLFSKVYDQKPNPQKEFAAIMVCTEADQGCPFVAGAEARFSIPFTDPKIGDGTAQMQEKYDEAVQIIGREFFYAVQYATELLRAETTSQ